MPAPSSKINGSSSSGNSFADLSDSIIAAIEAGFQNAATQAQTGSAATSLGAASGGSVSSIIEPVGGIGGAGRSGPSPADHDAGAGEHGGSSPSSGGEHGSGEEGKPEHEGGEHSEHGRVKSAGEYFDRLKEGFWEEEVGIGYPALELATGIAKRVEKLDSGQYVSPEEKQASLAEAVLPGAGGLIGAAVGTAFGNPVLGSFIGQGIGEVGASVIGAKSERDETTREAAEKLAAALGLAESSVHTFRAQIEATGAPVAQVSQGLALLENTGIVGGSRAIAGQGQLALGLGEQFGPVETTLTQTLSQNPALFQAADQFAQNGTLGTSDFRQLAQYELLQGNLPAYTAAQQATSATRYTANPEISKLEKDKSLIDSSVINQAGNWVGGLLSGHNIENEDADEIDKLKEEDDKKHEEADKQKKTEDDSDRKDLLDRGQARFTVLKSDSDANSLIMRYRYDANGNASPEDLAKRLPGIHAALEQNAAADQTMIDQDQKKLEEAPADSPLRPAYELEISQLQADQIQKRNIRYQALVKENYLDQIKTSSAESSLSETRAQIEGKSASEIERQVARQSDFLENMARAPGNPLTPEEAAGIEMGALKARYAAKLDVYTERLDENSLNTDTAGLNVTRTRLGGGSPDQVLEAQQGVLSTYTDRIKELSSELERGGLKVADRIAKERELTSVQSAALSLSVESVRERDSNTSSILSSNLERDEAGLSRRVAQGGNAAVTDALYDTARARIEGLERQEADEKDPVRRAALDASVAKAKEEGQQLVDIGNTYQPTSAAARRLATSRADFQIDEMAPYMDGDPNASPFTAGASLLSNLQSEQRARDKNRADFQRSGRWRDEDETVYTSQSNAERLEVAQIEQERRTGFLRALPEFIGGSPGQGNLSGVLPTPGQSAFYAGNPFVTGTFGQPDRSQIHDGSPHTAQPGGAAGAFLAGTGVDNSVSALVSELKRLNDNIQRGSIGGRSPAMPSPSGYSSNVNLATNAYKAAGQ